MNKKENYFFEERWKKVLFCITIIGISSFLIVDGINCLIGKQCQNFLQVKFTGLGAIVSGVVSVFVWGTFIVLSIIALISLFIKKKIKRVKS